MKIRICPYCKHTFQYAMYELHYSLLLKPDGHTSYYKRTILFCSYNCKQKFKHANKELIK